MQFFNAIKQSISLFVPPCCRGHAAGKLVMARVVAVDCVWSWNYVMQRGSCCLMHTHSTMTTVAGTLPGGCARALPTLSLGGPSRSCSCMPGQSPRTACPSARRLTRACSIGLGGAAETKVPGGLGRLGAARRALCSPTRHISSTRAEPPYVSCTSTWTNPPSAGASDAARNFCVVLVWDEVKVATDVHGPSEAGPVRTSCLTGGRTLSFA